MLMITAASIRFVLYDILSSIKSRDAKTAYTAYIFWHPLKITYLVFHWAGFYALEIAVLYTPMAAVYQTFQKAECLFFLVALFWLLLI